MQGKAVIKAFRSFANDREDDLDTPVAEAEDLSTSDLVKVFEIVTGRRLVEDRSRHREACNAYAQLVKRFPDKDIFRPLVRSLRSIEGQSQKLVLHLLPLVNNTRAHDELCELLRTSNVSLRETVGALLSKLGGKPAFDTLAEMVEETHFAGRLHAVEAMAAIGGHHVVPTLEAVLDMGTADEKMLALKLLADPKVGGHSPRETLNILEIGLDDTSDRVVAGAIDAYGALCDEAQYVQHMAPLLEHENQGVVISAIEAAGRFCSRYVLNLLENKLREGPNRIRTSVLNTLERMANDQVLPVLMVGLSSRHIQVRKQAADALVNLAANAHIDIAQAVIWLLRSKDDDVRRMTADLVNRVEDPNNTLWPKLLTFLRDEDWWVRERVMDALVKLAGNQLTRYVVSHLNDTDDVVRRFFVDVLRRLKDPNSLGAVVRVAQKDKDWWVRERAIEALAEIGDPRAVPYIMEIMAREPELQVICIVSLRDMRVKKAIPDLVQLLDSEDEDVRLEALECIGDLGNKSLAPTLKRAMHGKDLQFTELAEEILTGWGLASTPIDMDTQAAQNVLDRMLVSVAKANGDDLVLVPGSPAFMKRLNDVIAVTQGPFSPAQIKGIITPLLTGAQLKMLDNLQEVDLSYRIEKTSMRFRANIFYQRTGLSAVFRIIKSNLPEFELLGLPARVRDFATLKNGIVLVGGPTGSGKSTTLATLIDYINRTTPKHIISLEDPIEFLHPSKTALVNQREIGKHAPSFASALRSTLRQDPDVILIGEMRDLATISFAVSAAETGHLVFGTVHTVSADTTVDRLINAFPAQRHHQVRTMLSESLRAVLCQYLLPRADAPGRCLASELMLRNDAVANLIRRDQSFQLSSLISTSSEQGMHSMDQDLMRLLKLGCITPEDAYLKARHKKDFESYMEDDSLLGGGDSDSDDGASEAKTRRSTTGTRHRGKQNTQR